MQNDVRTLWGTWGKIGGKPRGIVLHTFLSTVFAACGYPTNRIMTWQKKYHWRVTWPGEGHEDWVAYDGDLYIGRIMRDKTTHGKKGMFLWSGGAGGPAFNKRLMPHQGWEQEHWQAAKAVEDWYDRMREMNELEPR